jgi:hypothetical protein
MRRCSAFDTRANIAASDLQCRPDYTGRDIHFVYHPLYTVDAAGEHAHAPSDLVRSNDAIQPYNSIPDIDEHEGALRPGLPSALNFDCSQNPLVLDLGIRLDRRWRV